MYAKVSRISFIKCKLLEKIGFYQEIINCVKLIILTSLLGKDLRRTIELCPITNVRIITLS